MADSMKLNVKGVPDVEKALNALTKRLDLAARNSAYKGAILVRNYAVREFRGRTSAAPQPTRPTARTGHLRDSIQVRDLQRTGNGWSAKVGPTQLYGRRVELGFDGEVRGYTRKDGVSVAAHMAKSRPFPYMVPGFNASRPELIALYNSEFRKALS